MAIADNLVSHVYAESGDSAITDKTRSVAFSGTGSPALTTIGAEDAWNLPAGVDQSLTIPTYNFNAGGSIPGVGYSMAIRYRINAFGSAGGYNELARIGELRLQKNGSTTRARYNIVASAAMTGAETTATIHTLVYVFRPNRDSTSSDYAEVWQNQASRANNDPDYITNAFTTSDSSITDMQIQAPDTMDWDLLDIVYWDRELTDAEAAAVADDLRTEIPATGGGADTTPPTFSVAPAVSAIGPTTADLDATIDETGDIHWVVVAQADAAPTIANIQAGQANGGGSPVASGSMLAGTVLDTQITGLSAGTAYAVYLVAQDDEGTPNVQASATQVNFSTTAAGTITTGAFKNNAGVLQTGLSNLRVVVLNADGTTALNSTGNTTHASTAVLTLADVAITPSTKYGVITMDASGTNIGAEWITAT